MKYTLCGNPIPNKYYHFFHMRYKEETILPDIESLIVSRSRGVKYLLVTFTHNIISAEEEGGDIALYIKSMKSDGVYYKICNGEYSIIYKECIRAKPFLFINLDYTLCKSEIGIFEFKSEF